MHMCLLCFPNSIPILVQLLSPLQPGIPSLVLLLGILSKGLGDPGGGMGVWNEGCEGVFVI